MSRIRADQLVNRAGSGGPKFPNGVAEGFSVSGIVTATSFSGSVTGNVTGNADTATTATTATNAQGLTGTPNITVGTIGCGNVTSSGDVTGVNATFSGNLTVQGTTTTIDTAITEVDSLAVDGNVGIGSTLPAYKLDIRNSGTNNLRITTPSEGGVPLIVAANSNTATPTNQFFVAHSAAEVNIGNARSSNLNFYTGNTERLRITSTGKLEVYKGTSVTGKTSGSEALTVGNGAGNKRFSVYPDGTAVIGGQGTIANNNILLQNDGEAVFGGTGSIKVPVGTTGQRPGSAAAVQIQQHRR